MRAEGSWGGAGVPGGERARAKAPRRAGSEGQEGVRGSGSSEAWEAPGAAVRGWNNDVGKSRAFSQSCGLPEGQS